MIGNLGCIKKRDATNWSKNFVSLPRYARGGGKEGKFSYLEMPASFAGGEDGGAMGADGEAMAAAALSLTFRAATLFFGGLDGSAAVGPFVAFGAFAAPTVPSRLRLLPVESTVGTGAATAVAANSLRPAGSTDEAAATGMETRDGSEALMAALGARTRLVGVRQEDSAAAGGEWLFAG